MTETGIVRITRALLSVSDKTGLTDFAASLASLGVELVSTGGTAKAIRDSGLKVMDVSTLTSYPECFDGRVKTLHPRVHAGLLYERDKESHIEQAERLDILPIDLVVVNLYPFEATLKKQGVTHEEAIENIDIGGPAMIRGAGKNHKHVAVVTDPSQYQMVTDQLLSHGGTSMELRERLMLEAFQMTALYDAAIAAYLDFRLGAPRAQPLR